MRKLVALVLLPAVAVGGCSILRPRAAAPDEFAPFEDTIAELASWQHRIPDDLERRLADDWSLGLAEAAPASNPFRNIGRNDPCPCGSGKKFKKCCLA